MTAGSGWSVPPTDHPWFDGLVIEGDDLLALRIYLAEGDFANLASFIAGLLAIKDRRLF